MARLKKRMGDSEAGMARAFVLWFGAFGLLLSLLGFLGAQTWTPPSVTAEPMVSSASAHAGLPTAPESQSDSYQDTPALTF